MLDGHDERNIRTIGAADKVGRSSLELTNECRKVSNVCRRRVLRASIRPRRTAEIALVKGNEPVALSHSLPLTFPNAVIRKRAMDEYDRRPLALVEVRKVCAVDRHPIYRGRFGRATLHGLPT